jgi:hypothetical protein
LGGKFTAVSVEVDHREIFVDNARPLLFRQSFGTSVTCSNPASTERKKEIPAA